MIIGRSPLRISFSGGGTDLEEYHSRFNGYAISQTINKFTYVIAKLRRDDKLQGFSPDFASHLPPKKHHNTKPLQGQEIVLAGLKELKFSRGVDIYLSTDGVLVSKNGFLIDVIPFAIKIDNFYLFINSFLFF